jgi:hypothetical protein
VGRWRQLPSNTHGRAAGGEAAFSAFQRITGHLPPLMKLRSVGTGPSPANTNWSHLTMLAS